MTGKYGIYYKNNKVQQIRGFCNTVIFNGISNAAKQMNLSQSAISHQIGSLEEDLGLKLFKRVGNLMVLTEDGQRFYNHVIPVLKQVDSVYDEFLIANDKTKENELNIVGHHSAISYILPKYIAKLLNQYPKIELQIENISKNDALERLRAKSVDLAFFPIDIVPEDIIVLKTFNFNPTLLVSKHNKLALKTEKITPEDIANEQILLIDKNKILPIYIQLFEKYNIKSRIKFINADCEILRYFVRENIGCSFHGNGTAQYDKEEGMIGIDISHLFPILEYKLMSHTNILKQSIVRLLDIMNTWK